MTLVGGGDHGGRPDGPRDGLRARVRRTVPRSCAIRSSPRSSRSSSTVDGSIVSNVIDMAAHARLLLNRGRGPIGTVLSEAMFDVLDDAVRRGAEDVDTPYALRARRRRGRARHAGSGTAAAWSGYTAFLSVEPASGLGVVILQNGSGDKEHVVKYALDAVRACINDAPLPDVWFPPEPTSIPEAAAFVGDYAGDRRRGAPGRPPTTTGCGSRSATPSGRLERDPLVDRGRQPVPGRASRARALPAAVRPRSGRSRERGVPRRPLVPRTSGTTGTRRTSRRDGVARVSRASTATTIRGCPTLRVVLRKGRLALQFPRGAERRGRRGGARSRWTTAGSRRGSPGSRGASGSTAWWTARRCSRSSTRGAGTARSRTSPYGRPLARRRAERDARVVAAEAERVRQREPHVERPRRVRASRRARIRGPASRSGSSAGSCRG